MLLVSRHHKIDYELFAGSAREFRICGSAVTKRQSVTSLGEARSTMADSTTTDDTTSTSAEAATDTASLTLQLATLASCRPDVLAAKKRTALIQTVQDAIRLDPVARRLLAEWKGTFSYI